MLVGEAPYTGLSMQAILAKRLREPVPHVRTVRDTVPLAVDQALERVLSKTPADRFPTAQAFVGALSAASATALGQREQPSTTGTLGWRQRTFAAVALAGAVGLLLVATLLLWHRPGMRVGADSLGSAATMRLAVLPFENAGDSADAYFADGVTDEITTRLTAVSGLGVISRRSAMDYRSTRKPLSRIADE